MSIFPSEEEIKRCIYEYEELFLIRDGPPHLSQDTLQFEVDEAFISPFQGMDEIQLRQLLHMDSATGHVPFFNRYLCLLNRNPVESQELKDFLQEQEERPSLPLPPNIIPCSLKWQQLTGVCAILSMLTAPEKAEDRKGVLLADEVGVGKTGTVLGLIATVMHTRHRYTEGQSVPSIFSRSASFLYSIVVTTFP
jgi:hypothetical protein